MDNKIEQILKDNNYVSSQEISLAKSKLENLDPKLKQIWENYVKNNTIENITIDGISLNYLMQEKNYSFVAALFALQWLIEDPGNAKEVLLKGIR